MELVNQPSRVKSKVKVIKKNMENAVESGKGVLVFIFTMTAASFLLCRVMFAGSFFPCGAALITALMYKNRLNIYLLPVMVISLLTCHAAGFYVIGDMASVVLCGAVSVLIGRREWGLFKRSLIAASVIVITNCGYYIAANMLYRFSVEMLIFEVVVVMVLCYVFYYFLKIWFSGGKPVDIAMEKVVAITVSVIMLVLCSNGLSNVMNAFSLSLIFGLFFTLILGYKLGVLAGAMTGGICGFILVICAGISAALPGVFVLGGITAGFFKGQNKFFAAVCFAGACLAPGLINGLPELSLPVYAPLAASFMLIPIKRKWLEIINPIESRLQQAEVLDDIKIRDRLTKTLDDCTTNFEFLESLYSGRTDNRSVMGYQFGGMAHLTKSMRSEVSNSIYREPDKNGAKYSISSGEACYAREGYVSGDSYLCRALKDEKYAMILSDGMGKGEAASAESSLVVSTLSKLLDVGFDPEKAIKTVNSILLMQSGEEMFSTIDMAILDKHSGKLKLFKVGAAITYIKRGDKIASFKMAALPAGLMDGLKIDYIDVRLRPGDQIIMVSDGIIDSCREDINSEWLARTIAQVRSKDPQTMADLIMNKAVENYGVREKDDLTVLTFRLDGKITPVQL